MRKTNLEEKYIFLNMIVDANLFRLGSSIQKHVGFWGAAPVWGTGWQSPPSKNVGEKKLPKIFLSIFFFVLKSSETYAKKILPSVFFRGEGGSVDRCLGNTQGPEAVQKMEHIHTFK